MTLGTRQSISPTYTPSTAFCLWRCVSYSLVHSGIYLGIIIASEYGEEMITLVSHNTQSFAYVIKIYSFPGKETR